MERHSFARQAAKRDMPAERQCARPTCRATAAATLTYNYDDQTVWIDHLLVEDHPMHHDLCLHHADVTAPLQGWALEDRRLNAQSSIFTIPQAS